jgi:hypothetical protein
MLLRAASIKCSRRQDRLESSPLPNVLCYSSYVSVLKLLVLYYSGYTMLYCHGACLQVSVATVRVAYAVLLQELQQPRASCKCHGCLGDPAGIT